MAESDPDVLSVVQRVEHMLRAQQVKLEEHDKRFEAHDKQFEAIDERFEAIDKRFEAVDKRFEAIDKRFDVIEMRLDNHDRRFDRLEERMERGFLQLGMQIEQVQSSVQLLAEQMSFFARSHQDVLVRVERLEEKQELTDLRLRLLEKSS